MNSQENSEIWKRRLLGLDKEPNNLEKFYITFQDAEIAVKIKDASKAKKLYIKARELYIVLPNKEKHEVYHGLLALYWQITQLINEEQKLISDLREHKYELPKLVKYSIPIFVVILIVASLFFARYSITGHVVLSKETTLNQALNLKINESGNYTWKPDKLGKINSIMATGSYSGNGTVKIYIEKNGKRYLIFDNKNLSAKG